MYSEEILNKVGELIGQAVGLIESNPEVLRAESLDVPLLYELLDTTLYKIETRDEE